MRVCVIGGIERTRIRVGCIAYAFALNRKRSVRNVFDEKASLHGQSTASLCTWETHKQQRRKKKTTIKKKKKAQGKFDVRNANKAVWHEADAS